MSGGENMRRVLADTGIYALTGDSPIDQEIDAYAEGLGSVEDQLECLEKDLFAATATAECLAQWELLYRGQASNADLETRRLAVASALALGNGPVTARDMDGVLLVAGIRGSWLESGGKLVIQVQEYLGTTEAEASRLLGRLLPVGLEWELQ